LLAAATMIAVHNTAAGSLTHRFVVKKMWGWWWWSSSSSSSLLGSLVDDGVVVDPRKKQPRHSVEIEVSLTPRRGEAAAMERRPGNRCTATRPSRNTGGSEPLNL
jgi:hypothetical protein